MKKTVLIIVIVLVAASAFLFFKDFFGLGKSQNENGLVPPIADSSGMKQEMSNASEVVVTVNENSEFVPKVVNVKKGDKVTWINKSSKAVWPASAMHPTHLLYPEFDALRGLKPGENYSFVFEKVGSWKYHDHLNPSSFGTVEVAE